MSQPVMFLGQLTISVLLARYLSPEDIGLVAMVTTLINFAAIFRELGLGTVTIQRDSITDQQASNLFWVNAAFGFAISVVVCLLAWPISRLYRDARVVGITLAAAGIFVVTGLSVQHSALLRRNMRFGAVTSVNVLALLLSGAGGVAYAIMSHSYWAIVLFIVSRQVLIMVGLWAVSGWRPGLFRQGHGTKELLRSGLHVAGFDMINYWARNFDHVLIGRFLGADLLGIYRKGYEMLLLPITQLRAPLTGVSLPVLSRLQSAPDRLSAVFLDLVSAMALLSSMAVALMLLLVDWLVPLVLGRQWLPVIPVFNRLSIVAVMQSVVGLLGLLLITTGQTRRYLQWGTWRAAALITAFLLGIQWGLFGLITAYIAATMLVFVPSVLFCTRHTEVSARAFIERVIVPNAFSWSAFAGAVFIKQRLLEAHLTIGVASSVAAMLFAAVMLGHVVASTQRYTLLRSLVERLLALGRAKPASVSSSLVADAPLVGERDLA